MATKIIEITHSHYIPVFITSDGKIGKGFPRDTYEECIQALRERPNTDIEHGIKVVTNEWRKLDKPLGESI